MVKYCVSKTMKELLWRGDIHIPKPAPFINSRCILLIIKTQNTIFQKLKHILHTVKCSHLRYTIWSIFINAYTHVIHLYEAWGDFRHSRKFSYTPFPVNSESPKQPWFDFYHPNLVLSMLEFHINVIMHYITSWVCLFSTQHKTYDIHSCYSMYQ